MCAQHPLSVEFARHAWDFRDAAIAAQRVLGERDEYQLGAALPVVDWFGVSIELSLRSYLLAVDPSCSSMEPSNARADLRVLVEEACNRGLAALMRLDEYRELFAILTDVGAKRPVEFVAVRGEDLPTFDWMRKLCDGLLEVASAMAGYERPRYEGVPG